VKNVAPKLPSLQIFLISSPVKEKFQKQKTKTKELLEFSTKGLTPPP